MSLETNHKLVNSEMFPCINYKLDIEVMSFKYT